MRIRAAEPGDVRALSALATRTWSEAFGSSVSPEDEAAELASGRSDAYFAAALGEQTILVADDDGALVGYVQLSDVHIPEVDVRTGDQELRRLYVDTALQGRGLGPELLEAALDHPRLAAAARVFLQVWERNERAVALYERYGFRVVGTTTFTVGGVTMEDLLMVLERDAA
jgi:ribosomal protein S18 acetylase RimI-like enzyme